MQGSPLWWWCTHSSLTVFVLAVGTSTTSPCCVTQSPATWASGNTSREEPHGRLPSICVMDALPPRMSCPPATVGTTGLASPWQSSWTVRQTWPVTVRSACWPTWVWWAATTCLLWTKANVTTSFWAAPWATWRIWPSTAWPSFNVRRNTCSSGRSACDSSLLSRRSTAREQPTWTWANLCVNGSRSSTSWTCSCTSMQRTCSSSGSSSPDRGSTKRYGWRDARRGVGCGSKETRAGLGHWNTKGGGTEAVEGQEALKRKLTLTCPPLLRTTRAKLPTGEVSAKEILLRDSPRTFYSALSCTS